ncbi:Protein of unknown function [Gryllus bimaculatus]|nr:Protein of unknown function [Gryllus bimaculatus]
MNLIDNAIKPVQLPNITQKRSKTYEMKSLWTQTNCTLQIMNILYVVMVNEINDRIEGSNKLQITITLFFLVALQPDKKNIKKIFKNQHEA